MNLAPCGRSARAPLLKPTGGLASAPTALGGDGAGDQLAGHQQPVAGAQPAPAARPGLPADRIVPIDRLAVGPVAAGVAVTGVAGEGFAGRATDCAAPTAKDATARPNR
jgi:hypothetical protein